MQELNENVTGNYVEEDPVALLDAKPDFFRIFTLVIATQVAPCRDAGYRRRLCVCRVQLCIANGLHMQCSLAHSWDYNCVHVQMREEELLRLEAVTRSVGIPLLIARSYGLMGYVRVGWLQAGISIHLSIAARPCKLAACVVSTPR
jgi:hypothetical protein